MSNQRLIKRICLKSKELAKEKRKSHELIEEKKKLNIDIHDLKQTINKLNIEMQQLYKESHINKNYHKKSMIHILYLKLKLNEAMKEATTSQESNDEMLGLRDYDSIDILYSDESRSSEGPILTDDDDMIDHEYDNSICDSEDVDYNVSEEDNDMSMSEDEEHDLGSSD